MAGSRHQDARSDSVLLSAHTRGDPDAFGALIDRHMSHLWAVSLRVNRNVDDAADALQDALLRAHMHAGSFRGDAQVSSWLHRIVVNASLDRIRRERQRTTTSIDNNDSISVVDPRDDFAAADARMTLDAALDELPADQRATIVAVDIEGMSVAEASRHLGVPAGTVKSRCARARARLAVLLGHLGADDGL